MKFDLYILFPGILMGRDVWQEDKYVFDQTSTVDTSFAEARIVLARTLLQNANDLPENDTKAIGEACAKVMDPYGVVADDLTLIVQKDVDRRDYRPPVTDAEVLFTYLCYRSHIDHWIQPSTIKVIAKGGYGQSIFIDGQTQHWFYLNKSIFLLPAEQSHMGKLDMDIPVNKMLLKVLPELRVYSRQRYDRILNALGLFNNACRQIAVYPNGALVMMVGAFESLLELPRSSGKDFFAYAISALWGHLDLARKWAEELYTIRSQIVHGNPVQGEQLLVGKDRHYPHLEIGRDVFDETLLFLLESQGMVDVNRDFKRNSFKRLNGILTSNKKKAEWLLAKEKGWTYERFRADREIYIDFLEVMDSFTLADMTAESHKLRLKQIVFRIANEWLRHRQSEISQKDSSEQPHYKYERKVLEAIAEDMKYLNDKTLWSFSDISARLEYMKKVQLFRDNIRNLEPIFHEKGEFHFTLAEFLDRSLRGFSGLLE